MDPRHRGMPPAAVKQTLRREAGFGCCRCGYPFYQYHHIVPWNQDPHYRPRDMMIICPNCHDEVTNGNVSEDEQRNWKAHPINIRKGYASGKLRIDQKELVVNLGGYRFVETPVLLQMNGENMITVKRSGDRLLVSMRSYDKKDLLLDVQDNEWVTGANLPWDLDAKWRRVVLRQKRGKIAFEIDARKDPLKVRGTFWKLGHWFEATDTLLSDQCGWQINQCTFTRCSVGIAHSVRQRTA
jgi:hypothetical protein